LFSRMKYPLVLLAVAAALAAMLHWLASDFRTGLLGEIQDAMSLLFGPAYVLGALLSGNVHAPSGVGFFLGLLVQSYLLVLVMAFVFRRLARRGSQA
jgi:hypothetical protein